MLPQAAVKDSPAVSKFDTIGKVLIDILVAAEGHTQRESILPQAAVWTFPTISKFGMTYE
jgi:hypothetical protein